MKISFNWLKDYIKLDLDIDKTTNILTSTGLEVVDVHPFQFINKDLVIGKVISCIQHPNADKLKITKVDVGKPQYLNIICGSANIAEGQKVIVAPVGTCLNFYNGDSLKIKKARIRGEISEGMICAEDEIGISDNHMETIVLNTDLPPGTKASSFYNVNEDQIIDIDLTPNRTDAMSHIGVGRDLAAVLEKNILLPKLKNIDCATDQSDLNVKIDDENACLRYCGLVISDINITESPAWIKSRLTAIGVNSINIIVDIANYVMYEMGQPLHVYDLDKIKNKNISVKILDKKSKFFTIDNKMINLNGGELVVSNEEGPLCIAGIIGGLHSMVTKSTKKIFVESACFKHDVISKTSKKYNISTDASYRFERGTDCNICDIAIKRFYNLISKYCPNAIATSDLIDLYPKKIEKKLISVQYNNIEKIIGIKIDNEKILSILNKLEIRTENETDIGFNAIVPTYRLDVNREIDIIEEILRIYGYNNVKTDDFLSSNFIAPTNDFCKKHKLQKKITTLLVNKGFDEIITNSLTKKIYQDLDLNNNSKKNTISVLKPLSESLNVLRHNMIFQGLEVISKNIKHGIRNLKLFEFGKVYHKIKNDFNEQSILSIWITGKFKTKSFENNSTEQNTNFNDINKIVHEILCKLKISDISKKVESIYTTDQILYIYFGDFTVAKIHQINSRILQYFDISQNVFYAELLWDNISKIKHEQIIFNEISKFPAVSRDLSLILDKNVLYEDIKNIIDNIKNKKIVHYHIYDIYENNSKNDNKKTYTMNFILQDPQKTLKDKEIDTIMEKLIYAFEHHLNAEIKRN